MKREITVRIAPENDARKESAKLSLHYDQQPDRIDLDVNGASLLKVSWTVPDLAQDFLCIASCIYAADKAIDRELEDDKWTRDIAIEIPVEHESSWSAVAERLSNCIGYLTGDSWEIAFRHGEKRLVQKEAESKAVPVPSANRAGRVSIFWWIGLIHRRSRLAGR